MASNQASQRSAVPEIAARTGTKDERRRIATTVATSAEASKRSNTTHATSQWWVTCSEGRVALK